MYVRIYLRIIMYHTTYVLHLLTYTHVKLPDCGHSTHCPGEANDTPDDSKQHCS